MYPGAIAAGAAERLAVVMGSDGAVITYGELDARINQFAHLLREYGLSSGDRVAVLLENHPRFPEIVWAAQLSGLYYTAINWHLTADEVAYVVNDSDVPSAREQPAPGLRWPRRSTRASCPRSTNGSWWTAPRPGWELYETAVQRQPVESPADAAEGESMLYSSGTTGRSKGIRRSLTLAPPGEKPDPAVAFLRLLEFDAGDVYLGPAPLYHAAPLIWTMAVQRIGGTVVVMERFDPAEALHLIERHRVTHAQFVPTMFVRMLKLPEEERTGFDVSSLKAVVDAAAPCPRRRKAKDHRVMGADRLRVLLGHRGPRRHLRDGGGMAPRPTMPDGPKSVFTCASKQGLSTRSAKQPPQKAPDPAN